MRGVRSAMLAAGVLAGLSAGSAAAAEISEKRWIRIAELRLDDRLETPAGWAEPGWRIGEATLQLDPSGKVRSWDLTRSTGDVHDDRAIERAARWFGDMPAPPATLAGRPLVLRVAFYTPRAFDAAATRGRLPLTIPEVTIEEPATAAGGPPPVVITAVR